MLMAPADHIKTESDCAYIFPSAGTGYILFSRLLFSSGIRTADCPFFVYFISGIRKRNPEHFIGFELFFQGEYRAMEPLAHGQKGLYQWHCKQPASHTCSFQQLLCLSCQIQRQICNHPFPLISPACHRPF